MNKAAIPYEQYNWLAQTFPHPIIEPLWYDLIFKLVATNVRVNLIDLGPKGAMIVSWRQ